MNLKTQTQLPAGVTITKVDPGRASGLEAPKMRAKGTGAPPEMAILRGHEKAVTVARIKRKARVARTTSEDVARALCAIRYGG